MIWQLIYRTTNMLRWGVSNSGGDLSAAQIDKNTADLEERVWDLENDPPAAIGISNIVQTGNQFTVYLEDATSFGPFTLPVATFRFLEDGWQPNTGLFQWDLFVFERAGFYLVLQNHETGDEFDPNEANTEGNLYRFLFNPFAGSAVKDIEEGTDATYFPELLDANKYLRWSSESDLLVTIPLNADTPFELDTEIHFRQVGEGAIIIEGDVGVTINNSRPGFITATPWQGANCTLKQVAIDEWDYMGPGAEEGTA